jgi:hypothetical protein
MRLGILMWISRKNLWYLDSGSGISEANIEIRFESLTPEQAQALFAKITAAAKSHIQDSETRRESHD